MIFLTLFLLFTHFKLFIFFIMGIANRVRGYIFVMKGVCSDKRVINIFKTLSHLRSYS